MHHSLTPTFLVSAPLLEDTRFARSVILICQHSDDGAMGLVVNKTVPGLRLPDLLSQLRISGADMAPDLPVLRGGPVERERGFALHSDDFKSKLGSLQVLPNILLTHSTDVLDALASPTPPSLALMALGYAGWGPGQLERELLDNAWYIVPVDEDILFDQDQDSKWDRAMELIGVNATRLSTSSGHA